MQYNHNKIFIMQNHLHVSTNIYPSSHWLQKQKGNRRQEKEIEFTVTNEVTTISKETFPLKTGAF